MGGPLGHSILDDAGGDQSKGYRQEDRHPALAWNDAAPDKLRLPADAVERILPLLDPRGSANLGGDREMHRPVLVGEPQQLLECAQRAWIGPSGLARAKVCYRSAHFAMTRRLSRSIANFHAILSDVESHSRGRLVRRAVAQAIGKLGDHGYASTSFWARNGYSCNACPARSLSRAVVSSGSKCEVPGRR